MPAARGQLNRDLKCEMRSAKHTVLPSVPREVRVYVG